MIVSFLNGNGGRKPAGCVHKPFPRGSPTLSILQPTAVCLGVRYVPSVRVARSFQELQNIQEPCLQTPQETDWTNRLCCFLCLQFNLAHCGPLRIGQNLLRVLFQAASVC